MIRCVHCGLLHVSSRTVCPTTGLAIAQEGRAPASRRDAGRGGIRSTRQPRASADRSLVGVTLDEKYRIVALIGQGGMGSVYEAEQRSIGRHVAVKVLRPENAQKRDAVERMRHEARVVGQIGHPNICQIYDIGQLEDGTPYLVMERLRGETLAKRLETRGPVAPDELVEIALQVLAALEAAHQKGVIHRDLKPDNIFLAQRASGVVAKVLDFGISKATQGDDKPHNLTRTGMVMGTPYYMAPEQALGERNLDGRLDVWGMGVVLYEALSGRRPFVAKNYNALLVQILTAEAEPLEQVAPNVPAALARVVHRALAKKREGRFESARQLSEALTPFRGRPRVSSERSSSASPVQAAVPQSLPRAIGTGVQPSRSGTEDPRVRQAPEGAGQGQKSANQVRETLPLGTPKGLPETSRWRPGLKSEPQSHISTSPSRPVGTDDRTSSALPEAPGRRASSGGRRSELPGPARPERPLGGRSRTSVPPAFVETLDHWDEAGSSTSDEEEPTQVLARSAPKASSAPSSFDEYDEHTVVDDPPSFTEVESETETGRRKP